MGSSYHLIIATFRGCFWGSAHGSGTPGSIGRRSNLGGDMASFAGGEADGFPMVKLFRNP